jgi:CheY-like chemotaxis protein
MGGHLAAESQPGEGSTFTFVVPVQEDRCGGDAGGEPLASIRSNFNGRALVVEDNAINRRVLTELLRRRGLEVDFAVNGLEGYQRTTAAFGSDEAFDVVFMDMQMPIQDGYTTARSLKEHSSAPPIIALTASALKEDRDRCIDAGCDAYLPKPVDNALLDSLLAKYLAPEAEAMDQTSP